jgi:hypothetical protein
MKNLISLFLLATFSITSVTLVEIDDVKCEAHLEYFKESLSARDAWAIERKIFALNSSLVIN